MDLRQTLGLPVSWAGVTSVSHKWPRWGDAVRAARGGYHSLGALRCRRRVVVLAVAVALAPSLAGCGSAAVSRPAHPAVIAISSDGRLLNVLFRAPLCEGPAPPRPRVRETPRTVAIAMLDRFSRDAHCLPKTTPRIGVIRLPKPLGGRLIVGQPRLSAARRLFARVMAGRPARPIPRLIGMNPVNARYSAAIQSISVTFTGVGPRGQVITAQRTLRSGQSSHPRMILTTT